MTKKRKAYRVSGSGKWDGQALSKMREQAFGQKTTVELFRLGAKLAARDDDAVIKAAQEKRERKLAKARSRL